MRRQLMHGVAGVLALTVAVSASGAASAASGGPGHRRAADQGRAGGRPPAVSRSISAARLTLTGCVIRATGPAPAVLATGPGPLTLNGCAITAEGAGGGVTAGGGPAGTESPAGAGGSTARVLAANSTIRTAGGHGAMAADGGRVVLDNVNISASGPHSPALAAGPGGTLIVRGGSLTAAGEQSPVLRAAGAVKLHQVRGAALGGEVAVALGGRATLDAVDSDLSGPAGISVSGGDPDGNGAGPAACTVTCTMTGGSLIARTGPALAVREAAAKVSIRGGAQVAADGGVLISVADGGSLAFTASGEALRGDVLVDGGSAASLALKNGTTLKGAITGAALELDASSRWIVTGTSTITRLTGIGYIAGNGHDVYYDPGANEDLAGQAYPLDGGGRLLPLS